MRRLRKLGVVVGLLLVALLFGFFVVVPLVGGQYLLNDRIISFDMNAGRYREQRYILRLRVADRVEETPLSRMYRQLIGPPPAPEWCRVLWFFPSFTRTAAHGAFFSGMHSDADDLARYLQSGIWSEAAQREAIQTYLYLLHNWSGWEATLFVSDFGYVEAALAESGKVILDACDLPQLYDIRVEVRTGEEATFSFVAVADLPQMTGKPLGGVKIVLEVWEKTGGWTYRTDTGGSIRTAVVAPCRDLWGQEERKKLAMGFWCAKEGYVTVEGEFSLEDFRGKVQAHGRALLVRMPPTDR